MKRIGRVGERWGPWELLGRAGVCVADGKRAFKARRMCPGNHVEPCPSIYEGAIVVIQRRNGKRSAWRVRDDALVPELLIGTFQSWHSMLERCNRASHRSFVNYGAAGVNVFYGWDPEAYSTAEYLSNNCKRLDPRTKAFAAFVGHMGVRPAGCSLDRIDPRGNYEPGNVRWASKAIQASNRRRHWPNT